MGTDTISLIKAHKAGILVERRGSPGALNQVLRRAKCLCSRMVHMSTDGFYLKNLIENSVKYVCRQLPGAQVPAPGHI